MINRFHIFHPLLTNVPEVCRFSVSNYLALLITMLRRRAPHLKQILLISLRCWLSADVSEKKCLCYLLLITEF